MSKKAIIWAILIIAIVIMVIVVFRDRGRYIIDESGWGGGRYFADSYEIKDGCAYTNRGDVVCGSYSIWDKNKR